MLITLLFNIVCAMVRVNLPIRRSNPSEKEVKTVRKGTLDAYVVLRKMLGVGITDPDILAHEIKRLTRKAIDPSEIEKILRHRELSLMVLEVLHDTGMEMTATAIMEEIRSRLSFLTTLLEVEATLNRLAEKEKVKPVTRRKAHLVLRKWARKGGIRS